MIKKLTMKEKVLRFVESKGAARFIDIQEFVVDHNKGAGTYQSGRLLDHVWLYSTKKHPRGRSSVGFPNIYRGYYSSAFSGPKPWFLYGQDYLEKREDGMYVVVRDKFKEKPEHKYWWVENYKQTTHERN